MYVFAGHGFLGETELPTRSNPRHRKRDRAVGGMLGRRPSLARRPKDHAVLMQECFAATPPGITRRRKLVTDTFVPRPAGRRQPEPARRQRDRPHRLRRHPGGRLQVREGW
ncbi:hypothetical protein GCM10023238_14600 [Streptomyces heliomycini]